MKSLGIWGLGAVMTLFVITVKARPQLVPVAHHHPQEIYFTHHPYPQPQVHAIPLARVPQASSQTTVVRDALGNQGTAYAYQTHDGLSASAVAVSRSDNSKTLAFVPAIPAAVHHHPHHPAIAVHTQPLVYAQHHYQPALSVVGGDGVLPVHHPVAYADYHHG